MFDLTAPRDPENGQVRQVRLQLQGLLPSGVPVESNVAVLDSATRQRISDIDLLVNGRVIVLLKGGRSTGHGQLAQAEVSLPSDRNGAANPRLPETNPGGLPVVVYVTHLGPHARRGLEAAGVLAFGGGSDAAERAAELQLFLDIVVSLAVPPPGPTP